MRMAASAAVLILHKPAAGGVDSQSEAAAGQSARAARTARIELGSVIRDTPIILEAPQQQLSHYGIELCQVVHNRRI